MDNYRGITITSLFGKLLELICLEMGLKQSIYDIVNPMQCGFIHNRSPTMASLLISEAKAEKKQLFVASLDVRRPLMWSSISCSRPSAITQMSVSRSGP